MTHQDGSGFSVAVAALVLAAGPWMLEAWGPNGPSAPTDLSGFRQVLESGSGGQAVEWHDAETGLTAVIIPAPAFRDRAGRWCRSYEIEPAGEPQSGSRQVACRDEAGLWSPPPEQTAQQRGG